MKKYTLDEIRKGNSLGFMEYMMKLLTDLGKTEEEAWEASLEILGGVAIYLDWLKEKEA